MEIDGWQVDERQGIAKKGPVTLGGPDRDFQFLTVDIPGRGAIPIPARVARILLGDCPDCGAWQAGAEESAEIRSEMLAAIAALTGTCLLPCPCGGHLSEDSRAQIKAAQSGRTAEGALPWRPEIGGLCFYFLDEEWRRVVRVKDHRNLQCFDLLDGVGMQLDCDSSFDGIRPLGSLPVPVALRAKASTA